jgi:hypothetical protein
MCVLCTLANLDTDTIFSILACQEACQDFPLVAPNLVQFVRHVHTTSCDSVIQFYLLSEMRIKIGFVANASQFGG